MKPRGSTPLRKGRPPAITGLIRLRTTIMAAEEDYARPIIRLRLRFLAPTALRPSELRGIGVSSASSRSHSGRSNRPTAFEP